MKSTTTLLVNNLHSSIKVSQKLLIELNSINNTSHIWIYNWTLTIENKYIDKLETYVCLISIWRPTKISKWVRIGTFQDGRNTILVHEQKYYFFIFHFTITSCKSFASCKERFMVSIPSLSSFVIFEAIWKLRFVYFFIELKGKVRLADF